MPKSFGVRERRVVFPFEMEKFLDEEAIARGVSFSYLVCDLIDGALENGCCGERGYKALQEWKD